MKKQLPYLLYTALFLLACLVPGLGMAFLGPSPAAGKETVVRLPSLTKPDGSFNLSFLPDAADWFSHSFAFRSQLITWDSALKARLLGTSSQSQVVLGQQDWLFYRETLDDYTGADQLTNRQAFCAARSLRLAEDYVRAQGGAFLFTIAPNKASLYPDYLPENLAPAAEGYPAPLWEALTAQQVTCADLFAPFRTQEEILYFQGDSHWTNRGAAFAHDVLAEALGLPGRDFQRPGQYQPIHKGDLFDMLYPASSQREADFLFQPEPNFSYTQPIQGPDDLRIETESAQGKGSLLMFRDSFGNALYPLLAEDFAFARFSRTMPYPLLQMEELNSTCVILEIVERNLPLLAQAPFQMPAPQREKDQLPFKEELFQPEALCPQPASLELQPSGALVRVTGQVDALCDPDSPVYLLSPEDGSVWEAFPACAPKAEGTAGETVAFTAYLDPSASSQSLCVAYRWQGQWRLALPSPLFTDNTWQAAHGLLPKGGETG